MRTLLAASFAALCAFAQPGQAQTSYSFKHPSWMWEEGNVGVWHKARKAEFEAKFPLRAAHFGIGVFIIGVTLVKGYEMEKDVRLETGQSVALGGYRFRMSGIDEVQGPNYVAARARIDMLRESGELVETLRPEKRIYTVQRMPMTEAAIDTGLTRDLYVALGEALDDRTWTLRVQHKPFVTWIWGGVTCISFAPGAGNAAHRWTCRRTGAAPWCSTCRATSTTRAWSRSRTTSVGPCRERRRTCCSTAVTCRSSTRRASGSSSRRR